MPLSEPGSFETLSERSIRDEASLALRPGHMLQPGHMLHPGQALPPGQALSAICLLAPLEKGRQALELSGLEGASILPCGRFWLLAEPVWLQDWTGTEGDAHLSDLSWVGPKALRHARQIEGLSRQAPVFPLPLGTLFSSILSAEERFAAHEGVIQSYLRDAQVQIELGVKVSFDRKALEQRLLEAAPDASGEARASGAGYLLRQRRVRELAGKVRTLQQGLLDGLLAALRPQSLAFLQLKRVSAQASEEGWEPTASFAFLVEKGGQEAFLDALEKEAGEVVAWCGRVEMTGPWPPYSFRPSLQDAEGPAHDDARC